MVLVIYVNFKTLKNLAISKWHLKMSIVKFVKPGVIFLFLSIMQWRWVKSNVIHLKSEGLYNFSPFTILPRQMTFLATWVVFSAFKFCSHPSKVFVGCEVKLSGFKPYFYHLAGLEPGETIWLLCAWVSSRMAEQKHGKSLVLW